MLIKRLRKEASERGSDESFDREEQRRTAEEGGRREEEGRTRLRQLGPHDGANVSMPGSQVFQPSSFLLFLNENEERRREHL